MNIAIILTNISELKSLLPLADILNNKHKIIFFIDNWKSSYNKKKYNIPYKKNLKKFLKNYKFQVFKTKDELKKLIIKNDPQKILSLFWPSYFDVINKTCKWVGVSIANDVYQRGDLKTLNEFDQILTSTKNQDLRAIKYLKKRLCKIPKKEKKFLINRLSKKFISVGNISLNNKNFQKDRKAIFKKYKLSSEKKYLLLFVHDTWAYRDEYNQFIMNMNKFQQIFHLLKKPSLDKIKIFFKNYRFSSLIEKIIKFGEINNFEIIIKSRKKSVIPKIIKEKNIKIFYDESLYPSTTAELIYISEICVLTYISYLIHDCAYLHKPLILIIPKNENENKKDMTYFNTKICQKIMFDNSYFFSKNLILRVHPFNFINNLFKKNIKKIKTFNSNFSNVNFIKRNIYSNYSLKKNFKTVDVSKILKILKV